MLEIGATSKDEDDNSYRRTTADINEALRDMVSKTFCKSSLTMAPQDLEHTHACSATVIMADSICLPTAEPTFDASIVLSETTSIQTKQLEPMTSIATSTSLDDTEEILDGVDVSGYTEVIHDRISGNSSEVICELASSLALEDSEAISQCVPATPCDASKINATASVSRDEPLKSSLDESWDHIMIDLLDETHEQNHNALAVTIDDMNPGSLTGEPNESLHVDVAEYVDQFISDDSEEVNLDCTKSISTMTLDESAKNNHYVSPSVAVESSGCISKEAIAYMFPWMATESMTTYITEDSPFGVTETTHVAPSECNETSPKVHATSLNVNVEKMNHGSPSSVSTMAYENNRCNIAKDTFQDHWSSVSPEENSCFSACVSSESFISTSSDDLEEIQYSSNCVSEDNITNVIIGLSSATSNDTIDVLKGSIPEFNPSGEVADMSAERHDEARSDVWICETFDTFIPNSLEDTIQATKISKSESISQTDICLSKEVSHIKTSRQTESFLDSSRLSLKSLNKTKCDASERVVHTHVPCVSTDSIKQTSAGMSEEAICEMCHNIAVAQTLDITRTSLEADINTREGVSRSELVTCDIPSNMSQEHINDEAFVVQVENIKCLQLNTSSEVINEERGTDVSIGNIVRHIPTRHTHITNLGMSNGNISEGSHVMLVEEYHHEDSIQDNTEDNYNDSPCGTQNNIRDSSVIISVCDNTESATINTSKLIMLRDKGYSEEDIHETNHDENEDQSLVTLDAFHATMSGTDRDTRVSVIEQDSDMYPTFGVSVDHVSDSRFVVFVRDICDNNSSRSTLDVQNHNNVVLNSILMSCNDDDVVVQTDKTNVIYSGHSTDVNDRIGESQSHEVHDINDTYTLAMLSALQPSLSKSSSSDITTTSSYISSSECRQCSIVLDSPQTTDIQVEEICETGGSSRESYSNDMLNCHTLEQSNSTSKTSLSESEAAMANIVTPMVSRANANFSTSQHETEANASNMESYETVNTADPDLSDVYDETCTDANESDVSISTSQAMRTRSLHEHLSDMSIIGAGSPQIDVGFMSNHALSNQNKNSPKTDMLTARQVQYTNTTISSISSTSEDMSSIETSYVTSDETFDKESSWTSEQLIDITSPKRNRSDISHSYPQQNITVNTHAANASCTVSEPDVIKIHTGTSLHNKGTHHSISTKGSAQDLADEHVFDIHRVQPKFCSMHISPGGSNHSAGVIIHKPSQAVMTESKDTVRENKTESSHSLSQECISITKSSSHTQSHQSNISMSDEDVVTMNCSARTNFSPSDVSCGTGISDISGIGSNGTRSNSSQLNMNSTSAQFETNEINTNQIVSDTNDIIEQLSCVEHSTVDHNLYKQFNQLKSTPNISTLDSSCANCSSLYDTSQRLSQTEIGQTIILPVATCQTELCSSISQVCTHSSEMTVSDISSSNMAISSCSECQYDSCSRCIEESNNIVSSSDQHAAVLITQCNSVESDVSETSNIRWKSHAADTSISVSQLDDTTHTRLNLNQPDMVNINNSDQHTNAASEIYKRDSCIESDELSTCTMISSTLTGSSDTSDSSNTDVDLDTVNKPKSNISETCIAIGKSVVNHGHLETASSDTQSNHNMTETSLIFKSDITDAHATDDVDMVAINRQYVPELHHSVNDVYVESDNSDVSTYGQNPYIPDIITTADQDMDNIQPDVPNIKPDMATFDSDTSNKIKSNIDFHPGIMANAELDMANIQPYMAHINPDITTIHPDMNTIASVNSKRDIAKSRPVLTHATPVIANILQIEKMKTDPANIKEGIANIKTDMSNNVSDITMISPNTNNVTPQFVSNDVQQQGQTYTKPIISDQDTYHVKSDESKTSDSESDVKYRIDTMSTGTIGPDMRMDLDRIEKLLFRLTPIMSDISSSLEHKIICSTMLYVADNDSSTTDESVSCSEILTSQSESELEPEVANTNYISVYSDDTIGSGLQINLGISESLPPRYTETPIVSDAGSSKTHVERNTHSGNLLDTVPTTSHLLSMAIESQKKQKGAEIPDVECQYMFGAEDETSPRFDCDTHVKTPSATCAIINKTKVRNEKCLHLIKGTGGVIKKQRCNVIKRDYVRRHRYLDIAKAAQHVLMIMRREKEFIHSEKLKLNVSALEKDSPSKIDDLCSELTDIFPIASISVKLSSQMMQQSLQESVDTPKSMTLKDQPSILATSTQGHDISKPLSPVRSRPQPVDNEDVSVGNEDEDDAGTKISSSRWHNNSDNRNTSCKLRLARSLSLPILSPRDDDIINGVQDTDGVGSLKDSIAEQTSILMLFHIPSDDSIDIHHDVQSETSVSYCSEMESGGSETSTSPDIDGSHNLLVLVNTIESHRILLSSQSELFDHSDTSHTTSSPGDSEITDIIGDDDHGANTINILGVITNTVSASNNTPLCDCTSTDKCFLITEANNQVIYTNSASSEISLPTISYSKRRFVNDTHCSDLSNISVSEHSMEGSCTNNLADVDEFGSTNMNEPMLSSHDCQSARSDHASPISRQKASVLLLVEDEMNNRRKIELESNNVDEVLELCTIDAEERVPHVMADASHTLSVHPSMMIGAAECDSGKINQIFISDSNIFQYSYIDEAIEQNNSSQTGTDKVVPCVSTKVNESCSILPSTSLSNDHLIHPPQCTVSTEYESADSVSPGVISDEMDTKRITQMQTPLTQHCDGDTECHCDESKIKMTVDASKTISSACQSKENSCMVYHHDVRRQDGTIDKQDWVDTTPNLDINYEQLNTPNAYLFGNHANMKNVITLGMRQHDTCLQDGSESHVHTARSGINDGHLSQNLASNSDESITHAERLNLRLDHDTDHEFGGSNSMHAAPCGSSTHILTNDSASHSNTSNVNFITNKNYVNVHQHYSCDNAHGVDNNHRHCECDPQNLSGSGSESGVALCTSKLTSDDDLPFDHLSHNAIKTLNKNSQGSNPYPYMTDSGDIREQQYVNSDTVGSKYSDYSSGRIVPKLLHVKMSVKVPKGNLACAEVDLHDGERDHGNYNQIHCQKQGEAGTVSSHTRLVSNLVSMTNIITKIREKKNDGSSMPVDLSQDTKDKIEDITLVPKQKSDTKSEDDDEAPPCILYKNKLTYNSLCDSHMAIDTDSCDGEVIQSHSFGSTAEFNADINSTKIDNSDSIPEISTSMGGLESIVGLFSSADITDDLSPCNNLSDTCPDGDETSPISNGSVSGHFDTVITDESDCQSSLISQKLINVKMSFKIPKAISDHHTKSRLHGLSGHHLQKTSPLSYNSSAPEDSIFDQHKTNVDIASDANCIKRQHSNSDDTENESGSESSSTCTRTVVAVLQLQSSAKTDDKCAGRSESDCSMYTEPLLTDSQSECRTESSHSEYLNQYSKVFTEMTDSDNICSDQVIPASSEYDSDQIYQKLLHARMSVEVPEAISESVHFDKNNKRQVNVQINDVPNKFQSVTNNDNNNASNITILQDDYSRIRSNRHVVSKPVSMTNIITPRSSKELGRGCYRDNVRHNKSTSRPDRCRKGPSMSTGCVRYPMGSGAYRMACLPDELRNHINASVEDTGGRYHPGLTANLIQPNGPSRRQTMMPCNPGKHTSASKYVNSDTCVGGHVQVSHKSLHDGLSNYSDISSSASQPWCEEMADIRSRVASDRQLKRQSAHTCPFNESQ